ncbi:hypothetical protein JZX87_03425 [Agrobacterium sp. Ap1]|uniref:hypothetical protein n=1 Tax=Agrobacterium sp. Ap1 TaxID=2815337 RepID=UPI001A8F0644|nr:hypothetical protein [Agrobacterium sp. Ap1]MBO0140217.1 hypothetical protein [Agrobacterium sp. Ap1]
MSRTEIVRGLERTLMASGATRKEARERIDLIARAQAVTPLDAQKSDDLSFDLSGLLATIRP